MAWPVGNPVARELDDFWKESQALWQTLIQRWPLANKTIGIHPIQ